MSQKYPASVCSLSSFRTTVPPCCVCFLYYCSERQICKISRRVAQWHDKAFVVQCYAGPRSWGALGASRAHPVPAPRWVRGWFLRGSCSIAASVAMGTGALRTRDAPERRRGIAGREWAPPLIPAGLAVPSAHRLLPFVGAFALWPPGAFTGTRLCCAAAGKREGGKIEACSRAFWSSAKYQVLPGDICQKPSGEGGTGLERRAMGDCCCVAREKHWGREMMDLLPKGIKEMSIGNPWVQELIWKAGAKLALHMVRADGRLFPFCVFFELSSLRHVLYFTSSWVQPGAGTNGDTADAGCCHGSLTLGVSVKQHFWASRHSQE